MVDTKFAGVVSSAANSVDYVCQSHSRQCFTQEQLERVLSRTRVVIFSIDSVRTRDVDIGHVEEGFRPIVTCQR